VKKSPPKYRVEVILVGMPESAAIAEQKLINVLRRILRNDAPADTPGRSRCRARADNL
jgi:hypothetical protein